MRTFVPCRRCGATHTNPQSSSLCPGCGVIESEENRIAREAEEAHENSRDARAWEEFDDISDIEALKDWLETRLGRYD